MAKQWRRKEQQSHTISSFGKSLYLVSPFCQLVALLLISGRKTEAQRGLFHLPPSHAATCLCAHLPADLPVSIQGQPLHLAPNPLLIKDISLALFVHSFLVSTLFSPSTGFLPLFKQWNISGLKKKILPLSSHPSLMVTPFCFPLEQNSWKELSVYINCLQCLTSLLLLWSYSRQISVPRNQTQSPDSQPSYSFTQQQHCHTQSFRLLKHFLHFKWTVHCLFSFPPDWPLYFLCWIFFFFYLLHL